ncbi:MAG TPA: ABC transporter permease, partial [Chloroflexi bacterium]|nr:ABC transporter permease [Chloroflexota bacterium]
MSKFVVRRLGFLFLTLFITSLIVFVMTQYVPGDVARVVLGREAGEEALEAFREEFGLNDPLPVQYLRWLGDFMTGDWDVSLSTKTEIRPLVMERLGSSLRLAALTLLIAVPLSIFLGVIAGLNENKPVDNVISVGSLSVVGLPEFVTGLVLIYVFARKLG